MRYKTLTAFSYHRGDQVRVTLWAESATGFQEAALKLLTPPVFIALTALKVNQYQGYTTPSFNVTASNSFFTNCNLCIYRETCFRKHRLNSLLF